MPRTQKLEISFWQGKDGIHIRLGKNGMTTVNDKDNLKRSHPHLYNQLKQILINEEKWQEE